MKKRRKKWKQKMPSGTDACSAKSVALADIKQECGKGNCFRINYLNYEYLILGLKKIKEKIINI